MPRTGGMTPGISPVPGKRIGVLGGSFNPAHEGHRHISIMALQRLRLDAVWWMISPQNPLKDAGEMAPLHNRVRRARAVASHPDVHVTDIEAQLGTRFTADTVEALKRRFPAIRFVWLMGADNLCQIPKWRNWRTDLSSGSHCGFHPSVLFCKGVVGPGGKTVRRRPAVGAAGGIAGGGAAAGMGFCARTFARPVGIQNSR